MVIQWMGAIKDWGSKVKAMTATIHSFEEAFERKHSTRNLLLPAFTQDYSMVELAEIEVAKENERVLAFFESYLEERNETK